MINLKNRSRRLVSGFIISVMLGTAAFGMNAFADESYDDSYEDWGYDDGSDDDTWSDDSGYDDGSDDDTWSDDSGYTDDSDSYDDWDDYDSDTDYDDSDDDSEDETDDDSDDDSDDEEEENDYAIPYSAATSSYYNQGTSEYFTVKSDVKAAEMIDSKQSSDSFSVTIFREMSNGMSGDDVILLQEMLIATGYLEGPYDGSFGSGTEAAVMAFQSDKGLSADGCVGADTLKKLFEVLAAVDSTKGQGRLIELNTLDIGKRFLYIENYEYNRTNNMLLMQSLSMIRDSYTDYNLYTYTIDTSTIFKSADLSSASGYAIDIRSTYESLLATVLGGGTTAEVSWNAKNYQYNNWAYDGPDYGYSTFIAVSIADQHLWYFLDGSLFLDTPVVTGMSTYLRHTPEGVYSILYHDTDVTLTGKMAGDEWESFVSYWMAISGDGIGMHDSSWRGTSPLNYGGYVYAYNGSHGCINIPYEYAELLYYNTYDGIPVIVY